MFSWGLSSRSWRISNGAGNAGGFPPTCSLSGTWRPLPRSLPVWRAAREAVSRRVARVVVSRRTEERSGHGPGGVTWWHPQRCGRRAGIAGISALGRLESKVLAQRCPFIVRAEQAALLQHRNHQIYELVTPPRQVRWCDVEPIAGALLEPGLHHGGDLLGGADHVAAAAHAGDLLAELGDRRGVTAHAGALAPPDCSPVLGALPP